MLEKEKPKAKKDQVWSIDPKGIKDFIPSTTKYVKILKVNDDQMPIEYNVETYVEDFEFPQSHPSYKVEDKYLKKDITREYKKRIKEKEMEKQKRLEGDEDERKKKKILKNEIKDFVKKQRTWFNLNDEESDWLLYNSRRYGDVGSETAGEADKKEAKRLGDLIYKEFKDRIDSIKMEIVDEWVDLNINL